MESIIEIKDLEYNNFQGLNISFESNKIYSVVGNNKSGKTTLLKVMCGIYPTSDIITCQNIPLNRLNVKEYQKNIGVVLNNQDNFIKETVKEELEYPLINLGYSERKRTILINQIIKEFSLEKRINTKITNLSFDEQKKLQFAISLVHNPKVLLIDNMFNLLNKENKKNIWEILSKRVRDKNLTIVNFTLCLEEVLESDYLILLEEGKIIKEGSPLTLLEDDELFYRAGLEVPFMIDLSIKLKFYGLIDHLYLNMEELVDDIWK